MKKFTIHSTWDSDPLADGHHTEITVKSSKGGVVLEVDAPFSNDPPSPDVGAGERCWQLWDYEVVEAFFLGKDEQYLEIELCPHGQYLALALRGKRNIIKDDLSIEFSTEKRRENRWRGTAIFPMHYLPPGLCKFNAYAIHGSGGKRQYEALYPTPKNKFENPDFHRLDYFSQVDFADLITGTTEAESKLW